MKAIYTLMLLLAGCGLLLLGCSVFSDDDEWTTATVDRQLTGEFTPIGVCEGEYAGWALMQFTGTGVGVPYGTTPISGTECFDMASGRHSEGEGMLVTEAGDEVHFTYLISDMNPATGAYVDTGEFTRGTGKFEDAHGTFTGQGTMMVQVDENGQPIFPILFTEHVTGEVTYRD